VAAGDEDDRLPFPAAEKIARPGHLDRLVDVDDAGGVHRLDRRDQLVVYVERDRERRRRVDLPVAVDLQDGFPFEPTVVAGKTGRAAACPRQLRCW